MCLTVTTVDDLGPAHAGYDPSTRQLYLIPDLTGREQDHLARDVLTQAGVAQPPAGVRCPCGVLVTMPAHATARRTA